ncbi:50S ribosomal protein L21 [Armatimonadota bacterium]|nr:50S ribosomal protein L21 [Armatimonadota bacterium]GDX40789.1 50S ribosomal protein L21 [Armatimonadota bacterium]
MYAIVKTGGKQYTIKEGDILDVEKLEGEADSTLELTDVLLISDGETMTVGKPNIEGAKVIAKLVAHKRGVKINGYTFKPKKNVHRRYGHRQSLTTLQIESIVA